MEGDEEEDRAQPAAAWARPQSRQGPGQLIARDPQSQASPRLEIARYHGSVVLQPPVAVLLRIREAELTAVPGHAAGIALTLDESGRLPAKRFEWLTRVANAGGRYDDTIRIIERRLRAGLMLDGDLRHHLIVACRQTGRDDLAQRAASDARESKSERRQ